MAVDSLARADNAVTATPSCRYCSDNPSGHFNDCKIPQELSDSEIDAADAASGMNSDVTSLPLSSHGACMYTRADSLQICTRSEVMQAEASVLDSLLVLVMSQEDAPQQDFCSPRSVQVALKKHMRPAVWQLVIENVYTHRKRKKQHEDDIMICQCHNWDKCGPDCLNRVLGIECVEVWLHAAYFGHP